MLRTAGATPAFHQRHVMSPRRLATDEFVLEGLASHQSAGGAVKAKITCVETIPLSIPFTSPIQIASGGPRPSLEVTIVRVHTDLGVHGVGETQAWRRQGSAETLAGQREVITAHLAPHLIGRSPFAMPAIMANLDSAIDGNLYSKAAISDALYDLQGKLLGVPVYFLLGGRRRNAVGACAIVTMQKSIDETAALARGYFDRGFRSFGFKIGLDTRIDAECLRRIREHLGPDAILRVDANASMQFHSALALLRQLEPYEIDVAEQPLAMWDVEGMAQLAAETTIPLAADECVSTDRDLMRVIRSRAASVLQTKSAKNGGIWSTRPLWHVAAAAGMRIYPGNHATTSIGVASVLHLAAAWPGDLLDGPFAAGLAHMMSTDIVSEPFDVSGPNISVPDRPGLGVTLDEDKVRSLRVDL